MSLILSISLSKTPFSRFPEVKSQFMPSRAPRDSSGGLDSHASTAQPMMS